MRRNCEGALGEASPEAADIISVAREMNDMADELVLRSQKWVNATYANVSGYLKCPEDGKTGWSTMFSLTRALQHELGITTLSDAFGPTTMAKLESRGDVGPGDSGSNIVKIVQAACFCKGYHAGSIDGVWITPGPGGPSIYTVGSAIAQLTADMGITAQNKLPAKVFKALLTMDAYVMVSGGQDQVQIIQRWLNARYWTKSFASIVPCEGIYSRDVQKALMKALQSEFGVPDASVTGNFGDQTRAGLRANQLAQGFSGILVQLLSAACVFNGPVLNSKGSPVSTVFKDSFDSKLAEYLTAFQGFSLLTVNGQADYATWCQLLVSTGDPDRPAGACDTRFPISQDMASSLYAAGFRVVGRYLDEEAGGKLGKTIKDGELADIFAGKMKVFPIWQYSARGLADFTFNSGYSHAQRAHDRMVYYKFNPGAIIYFSVDYDATGEEISSNIIPYFRGVQAGLANKGRRYRVGVYGSRNVCTKVSDQTMAVSSFVSGMSWGFSGNLGFPMPYNWAFNQVKEFQFTGGGQVIDLDRDVHRASLDPGIDANGVGGVSSSPVVGICDFVDRVYALAKSRNEAKADQLTLEFLRSPGYTTGWRSKGWQLLLGDWDQAWIDYAESTLASDHAKFAIFDDPLYGEKIQIDHLAATANGFLLKGAGTSETGNRGDFTGWGGDLTTFYGDWMNNEASFASGYAFCAARLAKRGQTSSFGFEDMIGDVDGYLLANACRAGVPFNTAFRSHFTGSGHKTRFRDFYANRFGSSSDNVQKAAYDMLTADTDSILSFVRAGFYGQMLLDLNLTPRILPPYKLDPFLKGFAATLENLAASG